MTGPHPAKRNTLPGSRNTAPPPFFHTKMLKLTLCDDNHCEALTTWKITSKSIFFVQLFLGKSSPPHQLHPRCTCITLFCEDFDKALTFSKPWICSCTICFSLHFSKSLCMNVGNNVGHIRTGKGKYLHKFLCHRKQFVNIMILPLWKCFTQDTCCQINLCKWFRKSTRLLVY